MIRESKCRRRIRGRIEDLVYELGRVLSYEEIVIEFKKRAFPRPFRKVVEGVLKEKEKGACRSSPRLSGALGGGGSEAPSSRIVTERIITTRPLGKKRWGYRSIY